MFKRTLIATLTAATAAACLPVAAPAAERELPKSYYFGMGNGNTEAPPISACPAGDVMVVGGGRYHEAELSGFGVVTSFSGKNIGAPGAKLSMHMLRSDRGAATVGWKVIASVPVTLDKTGSFDVPARIPVENTDRIALSKPAGSQVACAFPTGDYTEFPTAVGLAQGKFGVGSSVPWNMLDKHELLVSAFLEVDEDGDGWGDVSQDRCDGEAGKHQGCVTVKPKCKVPNLGGLTAFVAKQKITKAGCTVGKVTSKGTGLGTPVVQSQSKKAKTKVKSGTKIDFVIGDRG